MDEEEEEKGGKVKSKGIVRGEKGKKAKPFDPSLRNGWQTCSGFSAFVLLSFCVDFSKFRWDTRKRGGEGGVDTEMRGSV